MPEKTIFIGDVHGDIDLQKVSVYCQSKSKEELAETIAIQLGDFGAIFYQKKCEMEEKILNRWNNYGFKKVFFIPGNHENYTRLNSNEFPAISIPETNRPVKQISSNVFMLLHANVYRIHGKDYFVFRGGRSIDSNYRIPGRSWWTEELPSDLEFKAAKEAVRRNHIDYIVSHVGMNCFKNQLFRNRNNGNYHDVTEDMLENTISCVSYAAALCGHYHVDVVSRDYKTISLYETIIEEGQIIPELNGNTSFLQRI